MIGFQNAFEPVPSSLMPGFTLTHSFLIEIIASGFLEEVTVRLGLERQTEVIQAAVCLKNCSLRMMHGARVWEWWPMSQ